MRSTIVESSLYYEKKWEKDFHIDIREHFSTRMNYLVLKRCVDLIFSLAVILLVYPWLFPILILVIRLDSRGPAFFKQKRVGFLGKTFWCYKFRTMHVNDRADTQQAAWNDPRVTRVGKFLRNTCLDEIPQFINVLLGHMSIVGPRPHMLKDSEEFSLMVNNYKFRNMTRPGITGIAQARGYRGPATTFESIYRRYQWDAYYVRNINLTLDLKVMMETCLLILNSLFRRDKPVPLNSPMYKPESLAAKKIA